MEKLRIIERELIKAGFEPDFESYLNEDINVRIPLPKRKINKKTHLAYYGVIEININSCQIKTCGIIVETKDRVPNDEELKFNQRKVIKAMSKIVDIIHNSRITKEFAIEILKKSKFDEDITDFIETELILKEMEDA